MFGTDLNSAFPPLPPKSKNVAGNRTDIGWKHATDASGNEKKMMMKMVMKILEMISLEDYMNETFKLDNICAVLVILLVYELLYFNIIELVS